MSLPLSIAEECADALVVDVGGNSFVSLDNFDVFQSLETLILDSNELREENICLGDGCILRRVHTLYINKNQVGDMKRLAINIANSFPGTKHLSLLLNPACPLELEPEAYERIRRQVIYKLPFLHSLDSRVVTSEEKQLAEKEHEKGFGAAPVFKKPQMAPVSVVPKEKEEASRGPELKRDSVQAELVKAAKKDLLAKNRSISERSIRQSAGLSTSVAPGLVKANRASSTAALDSSEDGNDNSTKKSLDDDNNDDDDDSSCLVGQSDDSSEASALQIDQDNVPKGRNFAMMRSVSLSGRKLEQVFQYSKPQPSGKIVDREGWLTIRLKKTKWKRCWFVLKGGALFRYRSPEDEIFVEQILVTESVVGKSENRRGNCFKIEHGKEKLVFQTDDNWDQVNWIIALERYSLPTVVGKATVSMSAGEEMDETPKKPKRRLSLQKSKK